LLGVRGFEKFRYAAYLVLANHNLLNHLAPSELHKIRSLESASNLTSGNKRQSFDTLEIGVLDHHDAFLCQERFGVVVDELAIDEAVNTVCGDGVDFGFIFFLDKKKA
jgi:hypothetical protein